MANWKILLTDGLAETGKEIFENEKIAYDDKNGIDAETLLTEIESYDAMIVRGRTKVTDSVFEKAKNLKVVGRCGVGVDNIDLDAAKKNGVIVVNAPTATTVAVAEHAMALILSMVREIPRADAGLKNGQWLKKAIKGTELNEKVLGVIGFGHIGSTVGKYASAFGMRVIATDVILSDDQIREFGGEPVTFDELIAQVDIITLHVPLTKSTKHMIGSETIAKMKDGVRIISAARGGVIDENALLDALNSGKVAGAALDVFEQEPPKDLALVKHEKFIATPHLGGQTKEAQKRAAADIASEVLSALNKEELRWRIV